MKRFTVLCCVSYGTPCTTIRDSNQAPPYSRTVPLNQSSQLNNS
jgi:hypothetical protein